MRDVRGEGQRKLLQCTLCDRGVMTEQTESNVRYHKYGAANDIFMGNYARLSTSFSFLYVFDDLQ